MKKVILTWLQNPNSFIYKALNAIIAGVILFSFSNVVQLIFRDSSYYFRYESITPMKEIFAVWEKLSFLSKLERYRPTNMRYDDTLFCGFFEESLSWYSQDQLTYNNAPVWKFIKQWIYNWNTPTVPMICQLRSAPYASQIFSINTIPQVIETQVFRIR